jgi:3D (Asp-Asp-Asp) domain-containing protein
MQPAGQEEGMTTGRAFAAAVAACSLALLLASASPAAEKVVTLHLANDTVSLTTSATTVGGLLDELSIRLPDDASADPPPAAALQDGMSVYLAQVSVVRGSCEAVLPATVELEESWHYGPDEVATVSPGQTGLQRVQVSIFYLGGREVGRRQSIVELRPMKPQSVVVYRSLSSADGPSVEEILATRAKPGPHHDAPTHYKRIIPMESTAYEPGPTSCGGDTSGATACGLKAGYGVVAVDPDVIQLGTRLFISGYGYAVAGDTGGAIQGNVIDLGFMTLDECYAWGRRDVDVYVLY